MSTRRVACAALAMASAFGLVFTPSAHAALTSAEATQVKDLYTSAEKDSAAKLRVLIARPDVAATDAGDVFGEAARGVVFDDKHAVFLHDLLFGSTSQAARSDLVPVVVKSLLARSAEIAGAAGDDFGRGAELVRVHRFVAKEIGAAGTPPPEGHDVAQLIRDDALRGAASLYKEHLALPAFARARLAGPVLAGRAEAELALVELASGLVPRADVAASLGLSASARLALEKSGVLLFGIDGAPPAKVASVLLMIESASPASRSASALWIAKPWPTDVAARRAILVAQASLAGKKRLDPSRLWSSSIEPSSPDAALAEVAFTLARASFAVSTSRSPDLAAAAEHALARSRAANLAATLLAPAALAEALVPDSSGASLTSESIVAHGAQLLLLDAARATSTALVRSVGGRNEPMEQLALALGALATGDDGKLRPTLDLGRTESDGTIAAISISGLKGTPDKITEFTIDGHVITLSRDDAGAITRIERDAKPLALATIPFARR